MFTYAADEHKQQAIECTCFMCRLAVPQCVEGNFVH